MIEMYYLHVTVYIEVVLLNNFAVDFALCIATQIFRNKKLKITRAVIASCIGAVVACYFPVAPNGAKIAIKVLLAPLMSLFAIKIDGKSAKHKLKNFLLNIIAFCLFTYFTGGMVYGLSLALGVDINSYALLGIVATGVALCIITAHIIVRKKSKGEKMLKQVEIVVQGTKYAFIGLCDSGNLLVDAFSGLPVVVLSKGASLAFEDVKIEGSICVQTVAGDEHMSLIKPEIFMVDNTQKQALCAMSKQEFSEYDIILQNSLF